MRITCPTCKRPLEASAETAKFRPFCSERCRSVDLGSWLDAAYRISAPVSEEDLDEGLPPGTGTGDGDGEPPAN